MSIVIEAALVGVLVGIVVGSLGAGGGIIAVPVLVHALGQDPHDAAASSLVVVGLSSLVALIPHARRGHVDARMGLLFAAASVAGNLAAARLSAGLDGQVLMAGFCVMLLVVAAVMARRAWIGRRRGGRRAAHETSPHDAPTTPALRWDARRVALVLLTATGVGALTGLFGVGGGFAVVPALLVALRLPMRTAVGTSLLVLVISSVVGLLGRIGTDIHPDWPLTFAFAATAVLGALLGARVTRHTRPEVLTAAFAALLTAVGVVTAALTVPGLLG